MSGMNVNAVGDLTGNLMSSRISSKQESISESFEDTFNSVRTEKSGRKEEAGKAEVNKTGDVRAKEFTPSNKKDSVSNDDKELTDEQIAAAAEELIGQIKDIVKEQCGVSEGELASVMESMGIVENDLLDVNTLTNLVMKLEGVENKAELLTNQDLSDKLKNVLELVGEAKEQIAANVVPMENAADMESDALIGQEQVVKEEMDIVANDYNVKVEENVEEIDNESDAKADAAVKAEGDNVIMEDATIGNETNEGNSNGALRHDDNTGNNAKADNIQVDHNIQPQDFAARLTEDLSVRVGEEQATEIVRQVVEQVQLQSKQGMTTMELQLYPAHLGRVVVQLVSNEGTVTARISAETEAAKNALEGQLTILKENLNSQGVKIENVEVTIASHAFEQNMQGEGNREEKPNKGNRGGRAARILNEEFDMSFEEQPEIMDFRGNTVSYSA